MFLVGTYLHSGKVFFQENISTATSNFRQKETFFCKLWNNVYVAERLKFRDIVGKKFAKMKPL